MLRRGDVTGQSSSGTFNMVAQMEPLPPSGQIPTLRF